MFNRSLVFVALAATVLLSACSQQSDSAESVKKTPESADKLAELRVAIDPTYKPFTYKTDDGKPTGFDVDIASALCRQLKTKCVFVEQAWDGMIPGLLAKKYDVIISSMSITEERQKSIDFTGKYYNTPSCVVVPKYLQMDNNEKNFQDMRIGVLKASTQEKYALGELKPNGATIVSYDAQDKVYLDIQATRLDGTVADVIEVTGAFLSTDEGADYGCAGARIDPSFDKYFGAGAGVAIRKGREDLRNMLNKAITSIRKNGEWKKISEKYIPGVDIWGK